MGFGLGLAGAALGGLAGVFAPDGKANFTNPNFISQFTGPMGTSTRDSFTFSQDPNRQLAVDSANGRLQGLLSQIQQGPSQATAQKFQDAYLAPRQQQLTQQLQQQKQNLNSNIAGQGLGGSSSSLFAQGQQNLNADQQQQNLFNEAVFGGQQQADRQLAQLVNQFGLNSGLSQQDIGNRNAAFAGTQNAFNQSNQFELQKSGFLNKLAQARAGQQGNRLKNIIGGVTAGAGLGSLLGNSKGFQSLFGGGSGGSGGFGGSLTDTLTSMGTSPSDLRLLGL